MRHLSGSAAAGRFVLVVGAVVLTACGSAAPVRTTAPASGSTSVATPTPLSTPTPTTSAPPPAVVPHAATPQGRWWGVDSSGPLTAAALANARGWYGGATPQMWGRYVSGDYALSPAELDFARAQRIYLYLLVNDRNCSVCAGGGDICGSDMTARQASEDAQAAIAAAVRVGAPARAVLFKDIEQVSSCRGEPTPDYVETWYRTVQASRYRTGLYGNSFRPDYDFPRAYCAVASHNPAFARDVVLDATEPEPQLGADRATIGPHNAPRFAPDVPPCAPPGSTRIWQYGESVSSENWTDVDQADPHTPGMLAPDGTVT